MLGKYMPGLYDRLGRTKFTIVYSTMFSLTLSTILTFTDMFMFGDHFLMNRVIVKSLLYFVIGIFLAKHIIKRIKCGEL